MTPLRQKMIDLMTYRNLSPRTHESYLGAVERLTRYYQRPPEQISVEDIQLWLMHLSLKQHLAPASINVAANGIKFLYRQVLGQDDFLLKFKLPKRIQKIPALLTRQEVQQIIAASQNQKYYAMLSLCYGCGLRLGEVVAVKISHLDSEHHRLKVEQGKGKKDRVVPLPPRVLAILRQYWHYYRSQSYLFFSSRNEKKAVSDTSLQKAFHTAKKKAGIDKVGGVHSLRHAYATHQLDAGMPIHQLKDILGHTDIRTTLRYLNWCPQTSATHFDLLDGWEKTNSWCQSVSLEHG